MKERIKRQSLPEALTIKSGESPVSNLCGTNNSRDLPDIEWSLGINDVEKDALRDVLREFDDAISEFERDRNGDLPLGGRAAAPILCLAKEVD
jgi:hypothetical protein